VTRQQIDEHHLDPRAALKRELLDEFARTPSDPSRKRVVLRYCVSPTEILGRDHLAGIRLVRNDLVESEGIVTAVPTSQTEDLEASLVLRSVGFRGRPLAGLPFAERRGIIPNEQGRVTSPDGGLVPGVYVAGWIKRGATGTIGVNKHCARETVDRLLDDFTSGRLSAPRSDPASLTRLIADRQPDAVSKDGWAAIDRAERRRGASGGRPRAKFTTTEELITAARDR
jgi:ferredoxin/flavodoxin---NADP+ reductase